MTCSRTKRLQVGSYRDTCSHRFIPYRYLEPSGKQGYRDCRMWAHGIGADRFLVVTHNAARSLQRYLIFGQPPCWLWATIVHFTIKEQATATRASCALYSPDAAHTSFELSDLTQCQKLPWNTGSTVLQEV